MSEFFDRLFADFDEAAAEKAVEQAETDARLAHMEAQSQRQILDAYRAWKRLHGGPERSSTLELAAVEDPQHEAPKARTGSLTGRAAIMTAVKAGEVGKEWTIPTIAEALGLDDEAHRRLGVTLQRLVNDGALMRPRKGFYKLPPATADPGAGEEREAASENGSQNGSGQAVRSSDLFGLAGRAPS